MRRFLALLAFACAGCAPITGEPAPDPVVEMLVSVDDMPAGFDEVPATDADPLRFNPVECKEFMGLPRDVERRMAKIVGVNGGSRITIRLGEVDPSAYDVPDFDAYFDRCPRVVAGSYRSGAALTAHPYDVPVDAPAYASCGDVIIEAPADQSYAYGLVLVARAGEMMITAQLLQTGPTDLPEPPPDFDRIPFRQEFIDLVNLQVERIGER